MVFPWSLSDNRSPQVSRPLLNILADLNNAVVLTVSTRPIFSKFSNPCINLSVTVSRARITIRINVTSMFHCFFNSLANSRYFDWQNQREWLWTDKEKKQKISRKNNYRRRLRRWHSDTGKYTRPSRNTTA